MKVELAELLRSIEQLRKHLHELVKDRSFTDPVVLQASHRLDEVLNQYERLSRQK
ncbi:Spo0E family sporulation regulatory protein-aspartic acid phosphatase [Brevibacillus sp. H7]|uniref:Spo0E family sporulation regulatory protein-aspartic acid phosphatase n=1 Tax=Brevibacillus sp. H7 TaxID=3349138 RepID=UPI0037FBF306